MLTEEALETIECALSEEKHFLIEPITLNKCGHSICAKCLPSKSVEKITCGICGIINEQDFANSSVSKPTQLFIKSCMGEIFKILKAENSCKLSELKGIYSS
jgi:hypothetical protein